MEFKVHCPAENYLMLDFGNKIDESINRYVLSLASLITFKAVIEIIPAYSSILIEYDNSGISKKSLVRNIRKLKPVITCEEGKLFEIPVVYGGKYGPDLKNVAMINGISEAEVINRHCSGTYRVYMLGFMPGFCYLGGLDPSIACERLENPRLKIPAGSVGIAGMQTGIYPSESPGGWQIIGRTSFRLFRPDETEPFPIKAGDSVKFIKTAPEDLDE